MFEFFKNLFAKKESSISGKIIAAKVVKIAKHPNADRLRVVTLTDGSRVIDPVVCGAYNFDVGAIVALALPGATIAKNIHSTENESFVLGTAKIRGIESQGMICAAFELGLSDDKNDGIMLLPEDTPLGKIIA